MQYLQFTVDTRDTVQSWFPRTNKHCRPRLINLLQDSRHRKVLSGGTVIQRCYIAIPHCTSDSNQSHIVAGQWTHSVTTPCPPPRSKTGWIDVTTILVFQQPIGYKNIIVYIEISM